MKRPKQKGEESTKYSMISTYITGCLNILD